MSVQFVEETIAQWLCRRTFDRKEFRSGHTGPLSEARNPQLLSRIRLSGKSHECIVTMINRSDHSDIQESVFVLTSACFFRFFLFPSHFHEQCLAWLRRLLSTSQSHHLRFWSRVRKFLSTKEAVATPPKAIITVFFHSFPWKLAASLLNNQMITNTVYCLSFYRAALSNDRLRSDWSEEVDSFSIKTALIILLDARFL